MRDETAGATRYAWVILAVGTFVVFGSLGLGRFSYTAVLPAMQAGLAMDSTQAGTLATANLAGYLALSAVGGALAVRFGPRAVIATGLAVAGAAMVLTGFADGFVSAAVWRAMAGVGSGASNVPVMGLLAAWFAPQRRGLAAGIGVSGSSIGLIFVGWAAPPILEAYGEAGWRACWFVFGAITLGLAAVSVALLRNRPSSTSAAKAAVSPVAWGSVYRSGAVWRLGLVYVAFGFSYIIYLTFFVKFLMAEGGYRPSEAGDLYAVIGWFSLLCGLIWGTVSDRIGRKFALAAVYLIHAVAFALFPAWPSPAGFTISAVLFGVSAWSIPAIMAAGCGDLLGGRLAPAGLGFMTLFFGIGQTAAPGVAGAMADAAGSLMPAFWLAAGVALAGAVGSLTLPRFAEGSKR
ncbi:MAG: YbfB/YjiJ family MFS transporter [Phycisphaerae bacterium]|nr:YbfB/YjiJ family MFS transporter [Phycisphaerae bacterium]